jgi:predicted amidohydrolase
MSFKAAAIQMCSGTDPEQNAASMERLVCEAAGQGATYIQTPEMTGALQRDRQALRVARAKIPNLKKARPFELVAPAASGLPGGAAA